MHVPKLFCSAGFPVVLAAVWSHLMIAPRVCANDQILPEGAAPPALEFPHFPDRLHAFVFRNWPLVSADQMAAVVQTSPDNITAMGRRMGLPPQPSILGEWKTRGYITVLRRNWHLLPYDQLLTLLGMTASEMAYSLREDDFLFIKLGSLKPRCESLLWRDPDAETHDREQQIARLIAEHFPAWEETVEEPRFSFIKELSRTVDLPSGEAFENAGDAIRFIYSYFALFGDPLLNPELDPYPDGLLQRLARVGVNGIWLHTVLRNLAPSEVFPEFGEGHEKRLETLRALVKKAGKYGIGVYLYTNEPRSMPASFFERHPEAAGAAEGDHRAMCSSSPVVRQWLEDSLAFVFQQVPDLAGVFTITASENLTSCASHFQQAACPCCKDRSAGEIIAEVNTVIERGVHRGNPEANVIAWDWGWPDGEAERIIRGLPKSVLLQSVSEWSTPIQRGGIDSIVGEYSVSVPGPGPRASRHWAWAREAGLRTMAKVQLNNTWELAAVPYLPVLDLVAEHVGNLAQVDINGMMLSWSLGGYPSPNLEVGAEFFQTPDADKGAVLDRVAERRFGDGAADARNAWTCFSEAMGEFPYHISVLYSGPQNFGPMNLLYADPTGYAASMVGFPYDHLDAWRGPYPREVFARQFDRLAAEWLKGLDPLKKAIEAAPARRDGDAEAEYRFAVAAGLHFKSSANQARFVILRDRIRALDTGASPVEASELRNQMMALLEDEIAVARALWIQARADSRIGYEASNHYFYVPIDLVEKVLNCAYLMQHSFQTP